ncbi:alpha/beta hydrolase [Enterococcus sp. LJL51]|uniref:alpha/beta hydrolase n=1 Tax=Enterococcus sp. LJL51 TaxID=3416656 RepID=UPI003CF76C9C
MPSTAAIEASKKMMESKDLDEILYTPLEEQRKQWEDSCKNVELPEGMRAVPEIIVGLETEWLIPKDTQENQVIVYFHGGGLNQGSIITHRKLGTYVAVHTNRKVLLFNYPLAPEHPYPAAVEASGKLYQGLLEKGYLPQNIIFGSDSSGSTLSLATMLRLKTQKAELPKASFHFSPMIDYSLSGKSIDENKEKDPQLFKEDLELTADYYCSSELRKASDVSPLFGTFEGFPPILIHVGSDELLWSDGERLAEKMKAAGVQTEYKKWEGLWHVFQSKAATVPEAKSSLVEMADFLNHII